MNCRSHALYIVGVHKTLGWRFEVSIYRGVAKVVSRGIWDAEIAGSSPVTPTICRDTEAVITALS